jgi:hypothetical protein
VWLTNGPDEPGRRGAVLRKRFELLHQLIADADATGNITVRHPAPGDLSVRISL